MQPEARLPRSNGPERADFWVALTFLVLLALFVAVSWQKWPLLTADSARELYVPFQIRHGALIYRDFAYLYGPVAPWVQAGLLWAFGDRLEVLYVASLASLTATMGLLYTLARQVLKPAAAAVVLWIFFSHFALGQDIWGYVWPYAFAATGGVLLGLCVLTALARHAAGGKRLWLVTAGLAVGLSVVTKLEYGLAAVAIAGVYGVLHALGRPGVRLWLLDALTLLVPASAVAVAVALAVFTQVPWPTVRESVWPVRLMKLWDSQGTWHGSLASWSWNLKWLALVLALSVLTFAHARLFAGLKAGEPRAVGLTLLALGLVGWLMSGGHFYLDTAPRYWLGPGFLVLFALDAVCLLKLYRHFQARTAPEPALVVWSLIGAYGCLVATRTLMHGYNDYLRYQAPVTLIAWVGLIGVWLPDALGRRGLLAGGREAACGALTGVVLVLGLTQALGEVKGYLAPHVAVSGPVGTVLASPEFATPFLLALKHVKSHTRAGDAIVAAPMEASFYLFSGLDNVLHEDQLFWGYLTTAGEQQAAIGRIEQRQVRYVLVSNYGEDRHVFGRAYMQVLAAWITTRCRLVGDFGDARYHVRLYATPFASDYLDVAAAKLPRGI